MSSKKTSGRFHTVRLGGPLRLVLLACFTLPVLATAQETDPATIIGTIPVTDATDISTIETVDEAKVRESIAGFDPTAKIREIEREVVNGYLVYEVDVKIPVDWDVLYVEIIVDAGSGEVLGWWMDDNDDDQNNNDDAEAGEDDD